MHIQGRKKTRQTKINKTTDAFFQTPATQVKFLMTLQTLMPSKVFKTKWDYHSYVDIKMNTSRKHGIPPTEILQLCFSLFSF